VPHLSRAGVSLSQLSPASESQCAETQTSEEKVDRSPNPLEREPQSEPETEEFPDRHLCKKIYSNISDEQFWGVYEKLEKKTGKSIRRG
jgi:hypothetical protein